MKDLDVKHKRLLELSRLVRHGIPEIGFNMGHFIHRPRLDCKTTACIAGLAVAFYAPEKFTKANEFEMEAIAGEILELTFTERKNLFYARTDGIPFARGNLNSIKADHAARVVEHLALTDKIDWSQ